MPAKQSAGLLMFRRLEDDIEVLLAHPGGPFWQGRDEGAWTIPKGGIHDGEPPLDSAIREFQEETGFQPCGPYLPLGQITQRSGKIVHAWAFEGELRPGGARQHGHDRRVARRGPASESSCPKSIGVAFFSIDDARVAVNPAQAELFDRLMQQLKNGS